MSILLRKWLASPDAEHLQRLSPDRTETLLDHHLATFDRWLQAQFMSLSASSRTLDNLTVAALLDQLDPKEYNPRQLSVLLEDLFQFVSEKLLHLIARMKENMEFSRIVSKFLMDRDRAGSLWVNSQMYANLAMHLLKFLCDAG